MPKDPLDQLFVKPEDIKGEQRTLLAKMVSPFATIDAENGVVHFRLATDDLNAKQKVLIYLLARLALASRPNAVYPAAVSPREVEIATGLPGGTVRPKLMQLYDEHIAVKSGDGYSVSTTTLQRAYKELESVIESVTSGS
jgi:hypothetical protein